MPFPPLARLIPPLPPALLMSLLLMATLSAQAGERRKIIIDQDAYGPGGSNMQSILMLLQAPDVEVLGITITSGDGWRDEEVSKTLRLLEIAGRTDVPVYAGAQVPLFNSLERTRGWEAQHGQLHYKGAWTTKRSNKTVTILAPQHPDAPALVPVTPDGMPHTHPARGSAAAFMIEQVHKYPGQVTIWAGGPLTNVALAARLDPEFSGLAKELVFMGGSFNPVSSGNTFSAEYINNPRREFNMRWDPEAASVVLHEPWQHITEVPVDPTTHTLFRKELYQRIGQSPAKTAAYVVQFGQPFPMWDELAAAVWLDPSLVTQHLPLLVDVDTNADGASYGNTLSWPVGAGTAPQHGEREVDVVFAVDVPRFEQRVVQLLSQPSKH